MIEKAPHYIFPNMTRAMSTLFMFTVFFTIHVTDLMNETTFFFQTQNVINVLPCGYDIISYIWSECYYL